MYLSTLGHEEPRGNLGGPSSKAKYVPATDSEQVPRGKGEKHPDKGNEIDLKPCAYKTVGARKGDRVPFA